MALKDTLHQLKEKYKGTKMSPVFNAFHTFLYTPNETTHSGAHIRDAADLKRVMNTVIMALVPCLLFGMWNTGFQNYNLDSSSEYFGVAPKFLESFQNGMAWCYLAIGAAKVLPLVAVTYIIGLGVEFIFAAIKGTEVEEGFLVTGMLVPLIVPADLPLWQLAVAVIFGVVIGKEIFGGTGMNILNPALVIRAFLFFSYSGNMAGDIWVHESSKLDAISGATTLGTLASNGNAYAHHSVLDMFLGYIPGSIGETSVLVILIGAAILVLSGIGSLRIMLSAVVGAIFMAFIFNLLAPSFEGTGFYGLMNFPWWQHLLVGGLAFGIVFMATDPVSAAQTGTGKIIYGFLIGFFSILVRIFNPGFPEGVMMAILLMNVLAPIIDHYVVRSNVNKRLKRIKVKTA